MKILLTGATGFIGRRLHAVLRAAGHEVVGVGRHRPPGHTGRWLTLDFAQATAPAHWLPHLQGIDAVVNAVGILREQGSQRFDTLHVKAPCALFDACAEAGVPRVVQLSALGADEEAASAYHLSKKAADDHLLALGLDAVVAQPSLVFGEDGPSARFFLGLASLPLQALPAGGRQVLQPVHVDDAVQALRALVEAPPGRWRGRRVALVGPGPVTLAQYLHTLRTALGWPPAAQLPVPGLLVGLAARVGDHSPRALLDSASWQMLQRGNAAPADDMRQLLGHAPREAARFIDPARRPLLRPQAALGWLQPVLRASVALVWLVTAAVSLGLYPVAQSYELLARTGIPPALQPLMLYGAAGLDLLLGVLTLAPLRPRARRGLWLAQAGLMLLYTLVISWRLPEFWLHPYGPLLKNLPMLAVLLLLYTLEPASTDEQ